MRLASIVCVGYLLLNGAVASADLTSGLVAYYPFDGDAQDASGNGRHGTVFGATLTQDQAGNANSAYAFDGVDDYISFGNVLPDVLEMTVSMWVRCDPGGSGTSIFVDADGASGNGVIFGVDTNDQVVLVSNKSGGELDVRVPVGLPFMGRWRHVVWVLADIWTVVYVDGVESLVIEKGGPNEGYHNLLLGAQERPPGHVGDGGFWKGAISSLSIYDRVLSDAEIIALYDQDKPFDPDEGLVAYYPFAGDAKDQSGHGRHGTVMGATLTEDHHGVANQAYELDGVDDCIYFGPVLPDMEEMTLYMWVYSHYSDSIKNWRAVFCDGDWAPGRDITLGIHSVSDHHKVVVRADKQGFKLNETVRVSEYLSNHWICIAWVMTGSYQSVYVDGRELFTVPEGGSNIGNHNFILGAQEYPQGTLKSWWKGKISCVRIYDRPLEEREIVSLYEQDSPEFEPTGLTEGLVAHYPMDEGTGQTLLDTSGNGRNGTIAGRPGQLSRIRWIDGREGQGKALEFPATTAQHVELGIWDPSGPTGEFSVAFWMKWNGPTGNSQFLISKRNTWRAEDDRWLILIDAKYRNLSIQRDDSFSPCGWLCIPPVGQWQHVAYVYDGNMTTRWINGEINGSCTVFSPGPKLDAPMVIGAIDPSGLQPFNGALDDLRFYSRILTPAEVWHLAQEPDEPPAAPQPRGPSR